MSKHDILPLMESQTIVPGIHISTRHTFLNFQKEKTTSPDGSDGLSLEKRRFTTNDVYDPMYLVYFENRALAESLCPREFTYDHPAISTSEFYPNGSSSLSSLDSTDNSSSRPGTLAEVEEPDLPLSHLNRDKTTVMVRNVPNRYSQDSLIAHITKMGYRFDFFYCPIDRFTRANCGYFFVNLRSNEQAISLMHRFDGYRMPAHRSTKICTVSWAHTQGYSANVNKYRDSNLMSFDLELRPRIFDQDGHEVTFIECQPYVKHQWI